MDDLLLFENNYNEEERMVRDSVKKWVDANITSFVDEWYEDGIFPQELIPQLANMGLFGMTLPEQYGGSGASQVAYGLACQELEKGDSGLRSFVSVQSSLCMYPIFKYGNEEQKQRFLPKMAKGEYIGCFGLTEPDVGSDPGNMKTKATKCDGGWKLNGTKMWITNATIADLAIVWANTADGIRGFIVEKDFKGFSSQEIKHKLSLRASITGELILEDCFVPDANFLPGSIKGLAAPLGCLTKARYGIAWGAMGAAIACYDCALSYAKERIQFGKPIASFQLIQKDLVDCYNEILKAQTLNYQIGRLNDANKANFAMVSLAKMNACREALKISRTCRNILGANGISLEYPIMRHMTNLESVFTYEGTDNMHHLIVGRHITGESAFS
jgi:glutaryl-CoA dehydrogenase